MAYRKRLFTLVMAAGVGVAVIAAGRAATASNDSHNVPVILHEQLSGYQETPVALSTAGTGRFRAQINERKQQINYTLSYSGLEGTVTQAHIHFGAEAQTAGISVFLCSNLGNGPAGTQACPAAPATVSGVITPADVIGPTAQGIAPGEFAELLRAIRAGVTYVNVHSTLYPGGEIRAQLNDHH
ncbi:MAG TPA: CHRD domain-containing protein [Streptosporangiaceae bacterium]